MSCIAPPLSAGKMVMLGSFLREVMVFIFSIAVGWLGLLLSSFQLGVSREFDCTAGMIRCYRGCQFSWRRREGMEVSVELSCLCAGVPDRKFVKKLYLSRRSLDFQSFWYLSRGMPIFAIIRVS